MSSLDKIISSIINDTPVGELSKVVEDLKLIVDKNIDHELAAAIEEYNLANFNSVEVNGEPVIISKYNKDGEYFISEKQGVKFKVDHLKLKAFDVEEISSDKSKYDSELEQYVEEQYTQGEYLITDSKILIKGHKTSPGNYWTGSWRSEYDLSSGQGVVSIDVHYYEDGNVRLQTIKNVEIDSGSSFVSNLIKEENKIQLSLNKEFLELNERSFKQLRRQLPVTRSKINWGKAIGNYKLGKNINS